MSRMATAEYRPLTEAEVETFLGGGPEAATRARRLTHGQRSALRWAWDAWHARDNPTSGPGRRPAQWVTEDDGTRWVADDRRLLEEPGRVRVDEALGNRHVIPICGAPRSPTGKRYSFVRKSADAVSRCNKRAGTGTEHYG